jgi:hypothetical protein
MWLIEDNFNGERCQIITQVLIGDNFNGERCQIIIHVADRGYL